MALASACCCTARKMSYCKHRDDLILTYSAEIERMKQTKDARQAFKYDLIICFWLAIHQENREMVQELFGLDEVLMRIVQNVVKTVLQTELSSRFKARLDRLNIESEAHFVIE